MAEKNSKKRKRQEGRNDEPNKKAAVEGTDFDQVTVRRDNGELLPVLLSTPGLTPPAITFEAYSRPTSTAGSSETRSSHDLLLHSSDHPRLDYNASPATLDPHISHYIAIFDPSTKQLQISPAQHLSLRSTLRSQPRDDADKRKRTIGQQRADLGREFGTKKAKKAISDRTVNAIVKTDPGKAKDEAQIAILNSMAASSLPTLNEQEQAEAALAAKPIPKPDITTSDVEKVYTFDTLIPSADARLVSVKDWQDQFKAGEKIEFKHRYPAARAATLAVADEMLRLKALRYLTLLLEFHDALAKFGRDGKKVPRRDVLMQRLSAWPEALIDNVRLRFANTQNELPKWNMDNLYTHICALSLYVDVWTTDTSLLKADLKMENKEIVQYFRELGCKVSPPTEGEKQSLNRWWDSTQKPMTKEVAAVTRVAKLKTPLEFPKARSGRKK